MYDRLLLVEDNPGDARLIREYLRGSAFCRAEIEHVTTLEEALGTLRDDDFTAVLLDLSLPDSDGEATLESVLQAAPDHPVVVFTGTDDEQLGHRLLQAGAQDFLVKGEIDGRKLSRALGYAAERNRIKQALREAKAQAEAASLAKTRFLEVMSHELRTPLNAVIGYSEMLVEQAEEEELPDLLPALEKIHEAGQQLLALISDVLDIAKIESDSVALTVRPFCASDVVQEAVLASQRLVDKNGNTLTLAFEEGLEMRGDPERLRQILSNLLSNAAKFTENGSIELRVDSSAADWIRFRVSDTGIGIEPQRIDGLLEPFAQADSSATRRHGGTGLGLSIVQRLCCMMGGGIEVESEPGRGSVFTVTLPRSIPTGP